MSKSLLNFLVQISKALVNSKIRFLIQKSIFFTFGLTTLTGPLGLWPSWHRRPSPSAGQSQLCRPKLLGPCAPLAYLQKYVFFFDSRVPFSAPSLYPPADTWAPLVGFISSTAPADPGRVSTALPLPALPAPRLGCRRAITAPPSLPPLIPFKPSLNEP
jgi:hypothetical protein